MHQFIDFLLKKEANKIEKKLDIFCLQMQAEIRKIQERQEKCGQISPATKHSKKCYQVLAVPRTNLSFEDCADSAPERRKLHEFYWK